MLDGFSLTVQIIGYGLLAVVVVGFLKSQLGDDNNRFHGQYCRCLRCKRRWGGFR